MFGLSCHPACMPGCCCCRCWRGPYMAKPKKKRDWGAKADQHHSTLDGGSVSFLLQHLHRNRMDDCSVPSMSFYLYIIRILSRFYIRILCRLYPDFIQIFKKLTLSRFYPIFWKKLDKIGKIFYSNLIQIFLESHFVQILSWLYLVFVWMKLR